MNKSNNGKAISKHLAEYSKTHNEQEIRTELENNSELYDKQLREFSGKAKASFGKINYGGKGKRNEATVEFKLDKGNFTASGNIWNSKGQGQDRLCCVDQRYRPDNVSKLLRHKPGDGL